MDFGFKKEDLAYAIHLITMIAHIICVIMVMLILSKGYTFLSTLKDYYALKAQGEAIILQQNEFDNQHAKLEEMDRN